MVALLSSAAGFAQLLIIIELIAKMHEVAESLQIEGVQQVYVEEQLVLGPMEVMDQHQWDTAELREVGVHRRCVQHQKIKQAATCEVKRLSMFFL